MSVGINRKAIICFSFLHFLSSLTKSCLVAVNLAEAYCQFFNAVILYYQLLNKTWWNGPKSIDETKQGIVKRYVFSKLFFMSCTLNTPHSFIQMNHVFFI